MKNDNIKEIRKEKKSFQSQLFFIVLVIFILFIFIEYLITDYVLSKEYLNTEISYNLTSVESLKEDIENSSDNMYSILSSFSDSTDNIPLLMNSKGGITLDDSEFSSYKIILSSGTEILIPDYKIKFNVGDVIDDLYYSVHDSIKKAEYIVVGSESYLECDDLSILFHIVDTEIVGIEIPSNINFLYRYNSIINADIENAIKNIKSFKDSDSSGIKYFSNVIDSKLYYIIETDKIEDGFILIISSTVETKSLSKIVSSYYGYIILISVVIAVLIAFFISRSFSRPIKKIEHEMKMLSNGNYEKSDYEFTNSELTSLQDTLNQVKEDTKEKVELLEKQKSELSKANKKILSEEELRKSFIARLSHELKTPLMVIGATTEALADNMIDESEKENEYSNILKEVEKSNSIIKDIIESYKTTSKKYKLNKERFNLSLLVKEVVDPLRQILSQNHEYKELLDDTIYISADRLLIKEVISNYVTNAIKYTKENEKIEINLKEDSSYITFEVKNYGTKISKENLDKIWLPFFREKENIESTSTGMGLYIVKEILDAHKMEYNVTNFKNGVISYFKIKKGE